MPRAFIAVRIPATGELSKVLRHLGRMGRAVKPVAPENLHFTLRFLGNTDAPLLPLVEQAIRQAVGTTRAFDLELVGMGAFPHVRRPSIVWAGAPRDESLSSIVLRLRPLIDDLEFTPESRPWNPHLTMARIKARPPNELAEFLEEHADTPLGRFRIKCIDLMLSELRPRGAVYEISSSVPLDERV